MAVKKHSSIGYCSLGAARSENDRRTYAEEGVGAAGHDAERGSMCHPHTRVLKIRYRRCA